MGGLLRCTLHMLQSVWSTGMASMALTCLQTPADKCCQQVNKH
jgi:hypothetical protein